jgi:hypothetical protein
MCPCCQGQAGPLLGCAPKSPHPCPNATQVLILHRKASEAHAPLGPHITIVCPRCSCPPIRLCFPNRSHAPCVLLTNCRQVYPRSIHTQTTYTESLSQKDPRKSSKEKVRRSLHKHLNVIMDDDHGHDNASSAADNEDQPVNKVKLKEGRGWYVYLIISADMRKTYVGVTTDFERR